MNKKVVVISSSPRRNGNSETLAREFAKGATEAGNSVEFIEVRDLDLKFCRGCLYCQSHDGCVIPDSVNGLLSVVQNAEVLVFATPVYYYSVCGQLKTFLDRMNPLFPRENRFKDVYVVATCADGDINAFDGTVKAIEGWVDCFEGVRIAGKILCPDVTDVGDVRGNAALKEAYEAGKNV